MNCNQLLLEARALGEKGGEPSEHERRLFEEWMAGHCWAVVGEWNGETYIHPDEHIGHVHPHAMMTRRLWAAWRDRSAMASLLSVELQGVAETLSDGSGMWRSCSGCLETEDGAPVGRYPYSKALGCTLGSGCSECGGIGAIWDTTDYQAMADFMVKADQPSSTPTK